ncbi:MAG: phosphoribosylglycinamide formyltransferase [Campylobacterota bacterium]|nr:phosphoribosylglycinamide formyltransferase [Campylobacterota bacterium]
MSTNIAVFASGNGNGYEALLEAIKSSKLNAKIVVVISNNQNAKILHKADNEKIPTYVINSKNTQENKIDDKLLDILKSFHVDYIFLSGYMKMISPKLIKQYQNKIINTHPSLLPKFGGQGMYGRYVHEAVIESKEKVSGVTVHFVDEIYDNGEIILQKSVHITKDETVDSLEIKVKYIEQKAIVEAFATLLVP